MEGRLFSQSAPTPHIGVGGFSRLSVAALVGANLIPLFGVLFAGWRVFPILLLFSLENIVIGFYNVLRMRRAARNGAGAWDDWQGISSKRGAIGFFCLHYGGFVFGHLFFVVLLFGVCLADAGALPAAGPASSSEASAGPPVLQLSKRDWLGLGAAVLSLWISHGASYFRNFLGRGEYRRASVKQLFSQPYGRMVVMHVTIIVGAWAVLMTGAPTVTVAILVVLKIALDLGAHFHERRKFRQPAPSP